MYEMCAGSEKPGEALVWHVMAKPATTTLCGQRLAHRVEGLSAQRAAHCSDCMASFAKLMASTTVSG